MLKHQTRLTKITNGSSKNGWSNFKAPRNTGTIQQLPIHAEGRIVNLARMTFLLEHMPAGEQALLLCYAQEDFYAEQRAMQAAEGRARLRLVVSPTNPAPAKRRRKTGARLAIVTIPTPPT